MSDRILKVSRIQFALSLFWFLVTFSLVTWWWVFSFHQLELLSEVIEQAKLQSIKRMLIWEGAVLVSAVFGGGLMLVILTYRERQRNQRLRNFFSNFAHDLKTSITRLRLRAEVLADKNSSPELQKLIEETGRLDLQLENSLWVARGDSQKLLNENIKLSEVIGYLRVEWPELEIRMQNDAILIADGQALKSVIRNILQNAWLHGKATNVNITPQKKLSLWTVFIDDNGRGFSGDFEKLGQKPLESTSLHGNGLGLFLSQDLIVRMGGSLEYKNLSTGFRVILTLPAAGE
jgi:signal transduction histidine kinase